jgi:hypothetical protein
MRAWRLFVPVLVVLAGCSGSSKSGTNVEAASGATTTVATTRPAPTVSSTTVTTTATNSAAGTVCQTVTFSPTSDEIAKDITAYGMPCADAEAFIRKAAAPLGPEGLSHVESDGFACVQTSSQIGHAFPFTTYSCTNGTKKITFTRTRAG